MFVKVYGRDWFCNMDSIKYITIKKHPGNGYPYVAAFVSIGTSVQDEVILGEFDNHDDALRYVETLVKSS